MYANDAPWNDSDPDSTEPQTMSFISLKEKRFGRNSIWWVAFIHAASIYGMIVGGHWIAYVLCGSTLAVIWVASYFDWRALTKIDHGHPNNHLDEVCEGCDPICYKHGGPITNMVVWYAASYGMTIAYAGTLIVQMGDKTYNATKAAHEAYLAHPKFRNYPRP